MFPQDSMETKNWAKRMFCMFRQHSGHHLPFHLFMLDVFYFRLNLLWHVYSRMQHHRLPGENLITSSSNTDPSDIREKTFSVAPVSAGFKRLMSPRGPKG